jgi:hypothetical protein
MSTLTLPHLTQEVRRQELRNTLTLMNPRSDL